MPGRRHDMVATKAQIILQTADMRRWNKARPQQPVRRGRLAMKVSCSGRCTAVAFGFISITPGGRTLSVHSSRYHLRGKGSKRVLINFSPTQQTVLRSALARHRRIEAELFGAALDATGAPGRVTAGKLLPISG